MAVLSLLRSPSADYETSKAIPARVSQHSRALHLRAKANVKMMNDGERNLLDDLREVDDTKSFAEFDSTSLYAYAVDWLGLTPPVALNLIAIMRRSKQVPDLVEAIKSGRINVSAARKITPVINQANKEAWLELASTSSVAVVEKAVATASPKHAVQESMRYVTGERLEFRLGVSEEFRDVLRELKDVLSQKNQLSVDSEEAILRAMKEALARHSPLERAKRARLRAEKKRNMHEKQVSNSHRAPVAQRTQIVKRERIPSATKHVVNFRDGNRCTEKLPSGKCCAETRWLDVYHIIEVANGGNNSVENLRTVCQHHHRKIHENAYVS